MKKERVSFQISVKEGNPNYVEVMNVDREHWDALQETVRTQYLEEGILEYMKQDLPISLSKEGLLETEGEMRKIDEQSLSSNAYIALFSLDIFIRQLEDLDDSNIRFELQS